jgi:hypothetical protein
VDQAWVLVGAFLILGVGAALLIDACLSRRRRRDGRGRQPLSDASSIADAAEEWLRGQDRRSKPTG